MLTNYKPRTLACSTDVIESLGLIFQSPNNVKDQINQKSIKNVSNSMKVFRPTQEEIQSIQATVPNLLCLEKLS